VIGCVKLACVINGMVSKLCLVDGVRDVQREIGFK
jgi:hypothetical protein